ncbi:MAG TPA: copper resistance CopC family protein [Motilibacterales bacterium]|nr:copper resistance CopC family protein [Motilibacterales bacterium]
MRTHTVRGWIVGMLTLLALAMVVAPARAHAELESSDPQDGATLAAAPTGLTFVFGENILSEGNAVTLTDVAADARLEVGPVEVDGDTVSVSWPQSSPAGEFRAAYRVVSADGHPIAGTIAFTVEQAVGAAQASPAAGTASAPAASASPVPAPASPPASASPAPAADDADAGLLAWVLGIGLVVLMGAGTGAWMMRRSR